MRIKTSVLLSEDLLAEIDERVRQHHEDRSDFIEAAVRAFIARPAAPKVQGSGDLEILNRNAERLNLEAEDVLSYQVIP
jgi:metal-responsive CopG/Arc/MetJ family transcriptional regulator